jgi:hypothetical protein
MLPLLAQAGPLGRGLARSAWLTGESTLAERRGEVAVSLDPR